MSWEACAKENCIYKWNRLEFIPMDEIFQRMIDNNFSELKGLTVDGSIPLPQHRINEIIQFALQGNKNIEYCVLTMLEQNRVLVNLRTSLWPWPLDLKLRLEGSVDLTSSPKIRASLENNVLLGKLGSLFKAIPEGINVDGKQVIIDLEVFLTPEQKIFLDLIKSAKIKTEPGKAIFDVKIRVD